jgi:ribA/ribD-fused uncharacterized protein
MFHKMAIFFFTSKDYLSNFFPTDLEMNGHEFSSSEQAFMFAKCMRFDPTNADMLRNILNERDPKKVKKLGRRVRNYDDKIWKDVRYDTMVNVLRHKFACNTEIREALIATGAKQLYEASPYDRMWGIGYGRRDAMKMNPMEFGENLLGKALMEVRRHLVSNPLE